MDIVYPLLRFAHYALLLGLFGLTSFRSFGLERAMGSYGQPATGLGLTAASLVALTATVSLMLVSIAAMMAQPVFQVQWTTIEAMMLTTDIGWAYLARAAFLLTAVARCIILPRSASGYRVAAICYGLAVATLPWSGHAAASGGLVGTAHRANDAVHLLASGLWLGAIGWFLYLTVAAHRQRATLASPLLADMHKFAPLGVLLVAVIAITGAINAQLIFGIENGFAAVQTNYGRLLFVKLLLVCVMLIFGARNAWIVRRSTVSNNHQANLAKLRVSLGVELVLALLVIGLMAYIGIMSPVSD